MWLLSSAGARKNLFYLYVSTAKFGIKNIYTFMDKVYYRSRLHLHRILNLTQNSLLFGYNRFQRATSLRLQNLPYEDSVLFSPLHVTGDVRVRSQIFCSLSRSKIEYAIECVSARAGHQQSLDHLGRRCSRDITVFSLSLSLFLCLFLSLSLSERSPFLSRDLPPQTDTMIKKRS